jgi:hypothetical protein
MDDAFSHGYKILMVEVKTHLSIVDAKSVESLPEGWQILDADTILTAHGDIKRENTFRSAQHRFFGGDETMNVDIAVMIPHHYATREVEAKVPPLGERTD